MVKCVFCGGEFSSFKGIHRINNDGSISYFCSSKCRRNALNLKRDKRKVKWTEAYSIIKQKTAAAEKAKPAEAKAEKPAAKKKK